MQAPTGSNEDEECRPVDLFVRVPDTTEILLKVTVREGRRRRGWRGGGGCGASWLRSGRFYLTEYIVGLEEEIVDRHVAFVGVSSLGGNHQLVVLESGLDVDLTLLPELELLLVKLPEYRHGAVQDGLGVDDELLYPVTLLE